MLGSQSCNGGAQAATVLSSWEPSLNNHTDTCQTTSMISGEQESTSRGAALCELREGEEVLVMEGWRAQRVVQAEEEAWAKVLGREGIHV